MTSAAFKSYRLFLLTISYINSSLYLTWLGVCSARFRMSSLCFFTSGSSKSAASSGLCKAGRAPELVCLSFDLSDADRSDPL